MRDWPKPSESADLVVGAVVLILDAKDDGFYRAPTSRTEALQNYWFVARIIDLSDLFNDVVTVSGGYQVKKDALRVTVQQ